MRELGKDKDGMNFENICRPGWTGHASESHAFMNETEPTPHAFPIPTFQPQLARKPHPRIAEQQRAHFRPIRAERSTERTGQCIAAQIDRGQIREGGGAKATGGGREAGGDGAREALVGQLSERLRNAR